MESEEQQGDLIGNETFGDKPKNENSKTVEVP